jgi:Tol biopolymer transport system component
MTLKPLWLISGALFSCIVAADGATAGPQITEYGLPLRPTRTVEFSTDEGTQMSVDVSPDGKTVVFDLLGDIYTTPISGGHATRLTNGIAWDQHPRYSPDGKLIAFVSDRSGTENIWVIDPLTGYKRQITREHNVYGMRQPSWTPDGMNLVVNRDPNGTRPARDTLWKYEVKSGSGAALLTSDYESGGTIVAGGKSIMFVGKGGVSSKTLGDRSAVASLLVPCEPESCFFPLVSPDGHWLVYARQSESGPFEATLYLRNIGPGSGTDRISSEQALPVRVQIGEMGDAKFLPGYAFTPDSKALIFASDGRLKRMELSSGRLTIIPFEADVRAELGPLARVPRRLSDDDLEIKQSRALSISPDGKSAVVSAVGKIWLKEAGKLPRRLTDGNQREGEPSFSFDGHWIVYTTWSDADGGQLWKVNLDGEKPIPLTNVGGSYLAPRWLPDGSAVIVLHSALPVTSDLKSISRSEETTAYYPTEVNANNGQQRRLADVTALIDPDFGRGDFTPNEPSLSVSADGKRAHFLHLSGADHVELVAVGIENGSHSVEREFKQPIDGNFQAIVSPDERWLALRDRFNLSITPFDRSVDGAMPLSNAKTVSLAVTDTALSPVWANDSKSLYWLWSGSVYHTDIAELPSRRSGSTKDLDIDLRLPQLSGQGSLLLRGARIITMAATGQQANLDCPGEATFGVIERGDLLIIGRRIAAVGPSNSFKIPPNTRALDVTGMTIIPGLFDLLGNHTGEPVQYLMPEHSRAYDAALAYGITTNYTSTAQIEGSVAAEMLQVGALRGPREILGFIWDNGGPQWFDPSKKASVVRTMQVFRSFGHDFYKSREIFGHRYERQWLNTAAANNGLSTSFHQHDLSRLLQHVLDGYGMIIHGIGTSPIYRDVVQLLARSGTAYDLAATDTGLMYELAESEPHQRYWDDEIRTTLRRHHPNPENAIFVKAEAEDARKVLCAGGIVVTGDDSTPIPGLAVHDSFWSLALGGLTPMEILRIATSNGAAALGLSDDLGSIEAGKIADLVILTKNPLDDILNTASTRYVVKDGVAYDSETLTTVH